MTERTPSRASAIPGSPGPRGHSTGDRDRDQPPPAGWHSDPFDRIPSTDGVLVNVHLLSRAREERAQVTPADLNLATPLVLIAHATGFHGRAYQPLAGSLEGCLAPRVPRRAAAGGDHGRQSGDHSSTRSKVTVLAPDLRGHGDTNAPESGSYSWEGFADDLLAVIEHYDLRNIFGFGHSMGGASLLNAERRRPGTFGSLFLYEPIVFPSGFRDSAKDSPMVEAARRRRPEFPSKAAVVERYGSKAPLDKLAPEALAAYVEHGFQPTDHGTVTLKFPGPEEAEVYRMSTSHDTWDHLGEIGCPVTVAYGKDRSGAATVAPGVAARLPHGRPLEFNDLGHFGPLEDPRRLGEAIRRSWSDEREPKSS